MQADRWNGREQALFLKGTHMRKLLEKDRDTLLRYLMKEPEYNLFIIGDIENFGLMSETCEVHALDRAEGTYDCVVLRYLDNFIVYSDRQQFDAGAVAAYINAAPEVGCISAKEDIAGALAPFFPSRQVRRTYLSRIDAVCTLEETGSFEIRRLSPDDAADIVALYATIDEFMDDYRDDPEKEIGNMRRTLEKGGRAFGVFEGDTLIATAATSAENSMSAMVIGVATRKGYRGRGLATTIVSALCRACLDDGMRFLCLFYDNPEAGSIYRKVGFREVGCYCLIR